MLQDNKASFMTDLIFPAVSGLTPFDQQNLTSSTTTFERGLNQEEMAKLNQTVQLFHRGRPANSRSAVFYLEFPVSKATGTDGLMRGNDTMLIRVYSRYEMPTRLLFDGLLAHLTETLGIQFPALPAGRPDLPVHQPTTTAFEVPQSPRDFVRRGGRTFRAGT